MAEGAETGIQLRRMLIPLLFLTAVLAGPAPKQSAAAIPIDSDRDGLSDEQEQVLLEQFRPIFMISRTDCAVQPSRFEADRGDPKPVAADGTIYGQVFPLPGNRIEIHYYTLWDKDCGRWKHRLDAEHVSVLVSAGQQAKELFWYAGAHEKTSCDMSSGARAEAVKVADEHRTVWSSSGKHALYLRKEMCGHGCGADSCVDQVELAKSGPVINLGELAAPMNGATWIRSSDWPLADKMDSDFSSVVLVRLETAPESTIVTLGGSRAVRGTIQGGDAALIGAATGAHHTGAAMDTANGHTSRSLAKATKATGRALKRAWDVVLSPKGR